MSSEKLSTNPDLDPNNSFTARSVMGSQEIEKENKFGGEEVDKDENKPNLAIQSTQAQASTKRTLGFLVNHTKFFDETLGDETDPDEGAKNQIMYCVEWLKAVFLLPTTSFNVHSQSQDLTKTHETISQELTKNHETIEKTIDTKLKSDKDKDFTNKLIQSSKKEDILVHCGDFLFKYKINLMMKKYNECLRINVMILNLIKRDIYYFLTVSQEFDSLVIPYLLEMPYFSKETWKMIYENILKKNSLEMKYIQNVLKTHKLKDNSVFKEAMHILSEKNKENLALIKYIKGVFDYNFKPGDLKGIQLQHIIKFKENIIATGNEILANVADVRLFSKKLYFEVATLQGEKKSVKQDDIDIVEFKKKIIECLKSFTELLKEERKKCINTLTGINYLKNPENPLVDVNDKPEKKEYLIQALEVGRLHYNRTILLLEVEKGKTNTNLNKEFDSKLQNVSSNLSLTGHDSILEDLIELKIYTSQGSDKTEHTRKAIDYRNRRLIKKIENVMMNIRILCAYDDEKKYKQNVNILIPLDLVEGMKDIRLIRAIRGELFSKASAAKSGSLPEQYQKINPNQSQCIDCIDKSNEKFVCSKCKITSSDPSSESIQAIKKDLEFRIQTGDSFFKSGNYNNGLSIYKYVQKLLMHIPLEYKSEILATEIFLAERLAFTYEKLNDLNLALYYGFKYIFLQVTQVKDSKKSLDTIIKMFLVDPLLKSIPGLSKDQIQETSSVFVKNIIYKIDFALIDETRKRYSLPKIESIKPPSLQNTNINDDKIKLINKYIQNNTLKLEHIRKYSLDLFDICVKN